jgi:hypothetical protein
VRLSVVVARVPSVRVVVVLTVIVPLMLLLVVVEVMGRWMVAVSSSTKGRTYGRPDEVLYPIEKEGIKAKTIDSSFNVDVVVVVMIRNGRIGWQS